MEEYPLVSLRNLEGATDFFRLPSLHVAQRDHLPLGQREPVDCALHMRTRLGTEQALLGQSVPALWIRLPVAGPALADGGEALRIDGRLTRPLAERGERNRAGVALSARPRDVRQDPKDPGLEGRAALEAADAVEDREPGLLCNFLGRRRARDVEPSHPQDRGVVLTQERGERGFLTGAQGFDKLGLGCFDLGHPSDCNAAAAGETVAA